MEQVRFSVHILREGINRQLTFAISDTKEAVQLLTLQGQRKIVHQGNIELKQKLKWNI